MARRLLLCKVNVLASRAVFDDLAQAAEQQGVEWHVALERLERAVQATAEQRAQELIHEWLAEEPVQVELQGGRAGADTQGGHAGPPVQTVRGC